jgi:hypothetical protein
VHKGLRITKAGEPITARLVEPVYIGTSLAIPKGSTVQGHVSSVSTAPLNKRTGRLLLAVISRLPDCECNFRSHGSP